MGSTSDGRCSKCFRVVGTGGCTNPGCGDFPYRGVRNNSDVELAELRRVVLEVAEELAPSGAWLEEGLVARLARRLREAARGG